MTDIENTEENLVESPNSSGLEDKQGIDDAELSLNPLVSDINRKYDLSKRERIDSERRWVAAYYNYRGIPSDAESFTENEKSKAFIKITKTKVQASYGQILDILVGANAKFPLTIAPTEVPEGIDELAHIDITDPKPIESSGEEDSAINKTVAGFEGDGADPAAGETGESRLANIGKRLKEKFGVNALKGGAEKPTDIVILPAEEQAKLMEDKIHDQLGESDAVNHMSDGIFEMVLTGTGVLKGPTLFKKEYPRWNKEGEYVPVLRDRPKIEHVKVWDFYPDPAATNPQELDWAIERHRMTKSQMRKLKRKSFFRDNAIDKAIELGANFKDEWWEGNLSERNKAINEDRFEVLEYWGVVDAIFIEDELEESIPEEIAGLEEYQINAWICNGEVLRAVLNPFKPKRVPYYVFHYERDPYNFFGVGLPENMEDSQILMNGFARLAIDNAVLAGNIMLEVDEANLIPGQDMSIYAGKIWRRNGGPPGQAIFATKFPSTAQANMQMFDAFRRLADESTGIPSFSHGQTGVSGVGRTAAGISMLMGAASTTTKTIVKNLDNNLFRPLGEGMFAWNMQFDFDERLLGDLEVKARGLASIMQKEVRSQRLLQFAQIGAATPVAAKINYEYILGEIGINLDLDPDKLFVNDKRAALQARLMQMANVNRSGQQAGPAGPGGDSSGGGGQNIGVGSAPQPGEPGFSGGISPSDGLDPAVGPKLDAANAEKEQ